MRTVKLTIAFQGTRYPGWQSQRSGKAIQEIFQGLLSRILKEKDLVIHGSSRTDAGVHAKGFVAHFKTQSPLPDRKIKDALNYYLPPDVVVLRAQSVGEEFHARFSARSKTYEYLLWLGRTRPSYDLAPYCLWHPNPLDLRKMRAAAKVLVGKHDFSAFRDSGDEEKNAVRTLYSIIIRKTGQKVSIRVRGDGFLRHMVRVIVGTLIEAGRAKLSIKHIESILASRDRKKNGPTAKSHGLTLLKVEH